MSVGRRVRQGRTIVYGVITTLFALLLTVVSVRFVSADDPVGSFIVLALTAALWWRAWRTWRAAWEAMRERVVEDE